MAIPALSHQRGSAEVLPWPSVQLHCNRKRLKVSQSSPPHPRTASHRGCLWERKCPRRVWGEGREEETHGVEITGSASNLLLLLPQADISVPRQDSGADRCSPFLPLLSLLLSPASSLTLTKCSFQSLETGNPSSPGRRSWYIFLSHHCQIHFHPSRFPFPAPCSDSPPSHLLHTQTIPCHHTATSSWWNSHLTSHGRNFQLWQSLQCHPRRGFADVLFPVKHTAFIKTNVFPSLFLHSLVPGIANPGRRVDFVSPLQSWVIPRGIFGLFLGNATELGLV